MDMDAISKQPRVAGHESGQFGLIQVLSLSPHIDL